MDGPVECQLQGAAVEGAIHQFGQHAFESSSPSEDARLFVTDRAACRCDMVEVCVADARYVQCLRP